MTEHTGYAVSRRNNICSAITFLLISGLLLLHTFSDRYTAFSDPDEISTVFVPRILLILLFTLATLLLVRALRMPAGTRADGAQAVDKQERKRAIIRVMTVFFILLVMASIQDTLGFYATMALGILTTGWTMGCRNKLALLIVGLLAPLATWYIIVQLAELSLPAGILLQG
ncbi:tripartite tricarboxylate transporter TctB family protein [Granulosicoccus antarcticus]|uniref:DUF1468 domain-containing protein n=1 Tax=Granulosicoccus antarcticus IMCC3135 TaxID=1192854 RepID=A0A2Z2NN16_9GAMM|nr:tripartite tricarboxylate transporter TctB family protein [Granulosicoccus antarcticus]ASJ71311.1 hypothetical protein IMCC3135_05995 [Granulosicoccus antarcticus IMCC3135]